MKQLTKALAILVLVLLAVPVSVLVIGWMFQSSTGYYVAMVLLSLLGFTGWRRRTEHTRSSEYLGFQSRLEWLQEKDSPFKHR